MKKIRENHKQKNLIFIEKHYKNNYYIKEKLRGPQSGRGAVGVHVRPKVGVQTGPSSGGLRPSVDMSVRSTGKSGGPDCLFCEGS